VGEDNQLVPRAFRGAYKGDDEGFRLDDPINYDHDNTIYYVSGQSGRGQSQRIEIVRPDGRPHGIGQAGLGIKAGNRYDGHVVLRAEGPTTVEVSLGEQVRAIKAPIVRWPGGNFVSGYHWQDGIGDRDRRPVRFDQAR